MLTARIIRDVHKDMRATPIPCHHKVWTKNERGSKPPSGCLMGVAENRDDVTADKKI